MIKRYLLFSWVLLVSFEVCICNPAAIDQVASSVQYADGNIVPKPSNQSQPSQTVLEPTINVNEPVQNFTKTPDLLVTKSNQVHSKKQAGMTLSTTLNQTQTTANDIAPPTTVIQPPQTIENTDTIDNGILDNINPPPPILPLETEYPAVLQETTENYKGNQGKVDSPPDKTKKPEDKPKEKIDTSDSESKKDFEFINNVKDTDEKTVKEFPDVKDDKNSHFFAYLLTFMFVIIFCYLVFHNKKRIIAMVIEGRNGNNKRSRNRARYHKLDNNLEEAMNRNNVSEVY